MSAAAAGAIESIGSWAGGVLVEAAVGGALVEVAVGVLVGSSTIGGILVGSSTIGVILLLRSTRESRPNKVALAERVLWRSVPFILFPRG